MSVWCLLQTSSHEPWGFHSSGSLDCVLLGYENMYFPCSNTFWSNGSCYI